MRFIRKPNPPGTPELRQFAGLRVDDGYKSCEAHFTRVLLHWVSCAVARRDTSTWLICLKAVANPFSYQSGMLQGAQQAVENAAQSCCEPFLACARYGAGCWYFFLMHVRSYSLHYHAV